MERRMEDFIQMGSISGNLCLCKCLCCTIGEGLEVTLFRNRLLEMMATSSHVFLLTSKSSVSLG